MSAIAYQVTTDAGPGTKITSVVGDAGAGGTDELEFEPLVVPGVHHERRLAVGTRVVFVAPLHHGRDDDVECAPPLR